MTPRAVEAVTEWAAGKNLSPDQLQAKLHRQDWLGHDTTAILLHYRSQYAKELHPRSNYAKIYRKTLERRAIHRRREAAATTYARQERERQKAFERSIRKGKR
jgi:hypothetical protein